MKLSQNNMISEPHIIHKLSMFHIATTRFNNNTWDENQRYRNNNNVPVIYGTDLKIRSTYLPGMCLFVIEMNNESNKIMGMGVITNTLVPETHHIYKNYAYNFYIYQGKQWFSRDTIYNYDPEIVDVFDTVLFKGKSHLKRQTGITIISETLFRNWTQYNLDILKQKIRNMYIHHKITTPPQST